MAVYQTRAYFFRQHGYLTDNPNIGPALAKHYWNPGNSVSHDETLVSLTGEHFNAGYLAEACNKTIDEAWQFQQQLVTNLADRAQQTPASLNARIQIVDGDRVLASNTGSDSQMMEQFEAYVQQNYAL